MKTIVVFVATFIGIVVALGFVINLILFFGGDGQTAGLFGDSFGWVNAICSSLAATGAVVAVFLQYNELKEVRKESELARQESAKSAAAQQKLVLLQAKIAVLTEKQRLLDGLTSRRRKISESIKKKRKSIDHESAFAGTEETIKRLREELDKLQKLDSDCLARGQNLQHEANQLRSDIERLSSDSSFSDI